MKRLLVAVLVGLAVGASADAQASRIEKFATGLRANDPARDMLAIQDRPLFPEGAPKPTGRRARVFKIVYRSWRRRVSSHGIVKHMEVDRCTSRACTVLVAYNDGTMRSSELARYRCRVLRGTSRPDCLVTWWG